MYCWGLVSLNSSGSQKSPCHMEPEMRSTGDKHSTATILYSNGTVERTPSFIRDVSWLLMTGFHFHVSCQCSHFVLFSHCLSFFQSLFFFLSLQLVICHSLPNFYTFFFPFIFIPFVPAVVLESNQTSLYFIYLFIFNITATKSK